MMQYQKFEAQTSHTIHETEVITTKREKNPKKTANLQGKVSGEETEKKKKKKVKLILENA